jgi:hypothetical protein
MVRTMFNEFEVPKYLWAKAISMACYISNRTHIRPILDKTPFEICHDKTLINSYLKSDVDVLFWIQKEIEKN